MLTFQDLSVQSEISFCRGIIFVEDMAVKKLLELGLSFVGQKLGGREICVGSDANRGEETTLTVLVFGHSCFNGLGILPD
jgi:hypothetical protein